MRPNSPESPYKHSPTLRYTFAVVSVLVALAVRMMLDPYVGSDEPEGTFFLAVVVVAWFAGLGPALLSTFLGCLAADWFFIPPRYSLLLTHPADAVEVTSYIVVSCAIALFSHNMHRSRLAALSRQRQLAREIEHRLRVEEQLQQAKDAAEHNARQADDANHAKDRFLAILSHELRNPLTPVLAAASMLRGDARLAPDAREQIEMIHRNAELEARLIDDLLDVNRIANGKLELDKRPAALNRILEQAVEVCRPDIDARELRFTADLGPAGASIVDADPPRLQQVFWNLLRNAIKFTPKGGAVTIRCSSDGDSHVAVEVTDSGIGIDPEALGRIFNPFEQAERSTARRFGGLGLGLTITKAMAEMHGGSITAHSNGHGKGATFTVRLPISNRPLPVEAGIDPTAPGRQSETPNWSLRILLVEDHGDTAHIMTQLLSRQGHQVHAAADVATALELAARQPFDLLLSDLGLPDGSGLDLLRELRARGHTFPGVALSGYGQDQDVRQSLAAGFARHLTKPIDVTRLIEAVNSLMAKPA